MDNNIEQPHLLKKEVKNEFDPSKIELKKVTSLGKIKNLLDTNIMPYIKKRDLSDPFDEFNYDGGNKTALEFGIRIKF